MQIIVPRLIDEANVNAQNLNARNLLSRFGGRKCRWHCVSYDRADPAVSSNAAVKVTRLARSRFWPWHMVLFYQHPADAIFYPGLDWFDRIGLQWRDRTRRSVPVLATLEGLPGGLEREEQLERVAGHPVYCHRISREALDRFDYVMRRADHIVAISPFLAKMARALYGDKCSVLPMGVDLELFSQSVGQKSDRPNKVLGVGHVRAHKRPGVFLRLAERFRDVQFCWIGEGDQRSALMAEAARRGLDNLSFPGAFTRKQMADEMKEADVLVMTSRSEGVPKVTQEASASGVACIVFGYYEPSSVVDGQNGYVVWSDGELESRLGELLGNPGLCEEMGTRGWEISRAWDWAVVAPQWEELLLGIV